MFGNFIVSGGPLSNARAHGEWAPRSGVLGTPILDPARRRIPRGRAAEVGAFRVCEPRVGDTDEAGRDMVEEHAVPALAPAGTSIRARWASGVAWGAALCFAVATAGAVDSAAGSALAAFFLVLALVSPTAPASEVPRPARWAVTAAIVACVIQLVPLPEAVRAVIAPAPTAARADLRGLGLQGNWTPISVDVGATVYEGLLWAAAAAALAVLARREGPPFGARLAVGALVVLHVVAWIDWVAGTRVFPLTQIEDPWGLGQARLRFMDFAGWLVNRNHWAALGTILWPLAAHWAWTGGTARRVAGTLAVVGVVASVLATGSRAGLAVVALQGLALVAFVGLRLS